MYTILRTHIINGFKVEFESIENDTLTYYAWQDCKRHTARLIPCEWTKHLHGNAPAGTQYGSYRIITPDGKRTTFPVYE